MQSLSWVGELAASVKLDTGGRWLLILFAV